MSSLEGSNAKRNWVRQSPTDKADAQEVAIKTGAFYVPEGTPRGLQLARHTYDSTKKFIAHLLKTGWTPMNEAPQIRKADQSGKRSFKRTDSTAIVPSRNNVKLWVPTSTAIMPGSPWYQEGMDRWEITIRCTRQPRPATIEVPDDFIKRGKLPAGWEIK